MPAGFTFRAMPAGLAFRDLCLGPHTHRTTPAQHKSTRGGTRTRNLLLRREAPYPLGHTSSCASWPISRTRVSRPANVAGNALSTARRSLLRSAGSPAPLLPLHSPPGAARMQPPRPCTRCLPHWHTVHLTGSIGTTAQPRRSARPFHARSSCTRQRQGHAGADGRLPRREHQIRCSIVVSISACHAEDPGSIPGGGVFKPMGSAVSQRQASLGLRRIGKSDPTKANAEPRGLSTANIRNSPPSSVGRAQGP